MDSNKTIKIALGLLNKRNKQSNAKLHQLKFGNNNKVFKLKINNSKYLLKEYFRHPLDHRDRLGAEYSFTSFARSHNINTVPKPIAKDPKNNIAIFEFIPGRQLRNEKLKLFHIDQALNFILELNRYKDSHQAQALPPASEACFSIQGYFKNIELRINRLKQIETIDKIAMQAMKFVVNDLNPAWQIIKQTIKHDVSRLKIKPEVSLPLRERCISPSDFGFHNTLLTHDEYLRFIDFEYAGWDDPAKMICDFFCQPEIPIPSNYFDHFLTKIEMGLNSSTGLRERVHLIFPLLKLKWCCIMLNEFLPVDQNRRKFAMNLEDNRSNQLIKAKTFINSIKILNEEY
jgi:hypothetical protein